MTDNGSRSFASPRAPISGLSDTQDQLFGIVTALAAQVAVLREPLHGVEPLAQEAGLFGPAEVDAFVAEGEAAEARDALRRALIERMFRPVRDASARTAQALQKET